MVRTRIGALGLDAPPLAVAPGVDAPQAPDHDLLPDPRHYQVAVARLGLAPHRQGVSGTETRALERVSAHAQEIVRP